MKRMKIVKLCLVICLLLVFIVPFIYVGNFVFAAADDYCRATSSFGNFFSNVAAWYGGHNGRYTNALFSFLPVYGLSIYRIILMTSIIALGVIIFYFVRETFRFFGLYSSILNIALVAVTLYVVLISQLPSVYEFFYWYAATTVYLFSVIFFLLLLTRLYRLYSKDYFDVIGAFLIVLLIGNNEMFILLSNFILLGLLIYKIVGKQNFKYTLLLNITAWIATLAVVFAPGSENRQNHFPEGGNIFFSLKSAILSTGMFSLKSLFEWPYILVYLGFFIFLLTVYKQEGKVKLKSFNPMLLFFISFVAMSSVIFVPYYAQGSLSINEGRIGNVVHIVFLIILFINILNTVFVVQQRRLLASWKFQKSSIAFVLIVLFLIALPLVNANYSNLFFDIRTGALLKYEDQMEKMTQRFKSSEDEKIILEEIYETKLLINLENRFNGCYIEMVNNKYDLNLKEVHVNNDDSYPLK